MNKRKKFIYKKALHNFCDLRKRLNNTFGLMASWINNNSSHNSVGYALPTQHKLIKKASTLAGLQVIEVGLPQLLPLVFGAADRGIPLIFGDYGDRTIIITRTEAEYMELVLTANNDKKYDPYLLFGYAFSMVMAACQCTLFQSTQSTVLIVQWEKKN